MANAARPEAAAEAAKVATSSAPAPQKKWWCALEEAGVSGDGVESLKMVYGTGDAMIRGACADAKGWAGACLSLSDDDRPKAFAARKAIVASVGGP